MKIKDAARILVVCLTASGPGRLWAAADSWGAAVSRVQEETASMKLTAGQAAPAVPSSVKDAERRQAELDAALVAEAYRGNIDEVAALLAKGASPQAKDGNGKTVLMIAAENDYADVAQALLKQGAFVNSRSDQGTSALMAAAQYGSVDIIRMLLAAPGIKTDLSDRKGATAFLWACGHDQAEAAKLLVVVGHADPNRPFADGGQTCLRYSLDHDLSVTAAVLEAGADPNIPDSYGDYPLIKAATDGDADIVGQMLVRDADVHVRKDGYDALYGAATCSDAKCPAMAGALIKAGADGNQQYDTGHCLDRNELCDFTPLMISVAYARPEMTQALLDAGVGLNARDKYSHLTALGWAIHIAGQYPSNADMQQKLKQIEDLLRARGAQQ
jgi:ankyrin repeat protein